MSQYKPYPAYKDSGVEWLGRVPAHWVSSRVKSSVTSSRNGDWGSEPTENPKVCVRVADFDRQSFRVRLGDPPTLRDYDSSKIAGRTLETGDLLIEKSGGGEKQPVGAVVYTDYTAAGSMYSNFTARMTIGADYFPRFVAYVHAALYAAGVNTRSIKQSTGIQNLDSDQYFSESWYWPALSEQQLIAAFLDRETARIDALIEKKQRLIELLKEKRQAVITQAVTKGLDPNVPMKDSGVEWLGEVPEHWTIRRLKHSIRPGTSVSYGIVQPGDHVETGVSFIQTSNISGDVIDTSNLQKTDSSIEAAYPRSRLTGGEVILGIRATVGAAHMVPASLRGANLSRGIARIEPASYIHPQFLVFFLRGAAKGFWNVRSQGSTFTEVSIESVKELAIPLPSLREQRFVCDCLEKSVERLARLIAQTKRSIDLLQERRSALITAAVTGQIDVRDAA